MSNNIAENAQVDHSKMFFAPENQPATYYVQLEVTVPKCLSRSDAIEEVKRLVGKTYDINSIQAFAENDAELLTATRGNQDGI